VQIVRGESVVWQREVRTGNSVMSHSLANLEHHHFKHAQHRCPGDLHVHFYGADAFSFADGVRLADGDLISVSFSGFGRPLLNPVKIESGPAAMVAVEEL
jgi:hypothetical protein